MFLFALHFIVGTNSSSPSRHWLRPSSVVHELCRKASKYVFFRLFIVVLVLQPFFPVFCLLRQRCLAIFFSGTICNLYYKFQGMTARNALSLFISVLFFVPTDYMKSNFTDLTESFPICFYFYRYLLATCLFVFLMTFWITLL